MLDPDTSPADGAATRPSRVAISKRVMVINAGSAVTYQLLSVAVLFWLQRYLLARVSPDEYAIYAVLMTLVLSIKVLNAVLGVGLARSVLTAYAAGDGERVARVVSTMFPLCAGVAALLAAAAVLLSGHIDTLVPVGVELALVDPGAAADLRAETRVMFAVLCVLAALQAAFLPFQLGITLEQKFVWRHLIQLAAEMIRIGTMFVLLFGVSTKVLWVVVAAIPATLFSVSVTCWLSRRLVPELRFRPALFTRSLIRPVVSTGGWTLVSRVGTTAREMLGMLMLNQPAWAGPVAVADFRLAKIVDNQLRRTVFAVVPMLQPALTAMHSTGQGERFRRSYLRIARYGAWVLLGAATPLMIYSSQFYRLYLGEGSAVYHAAAAALVVLMARFAVLFARPAITAIAIASGRIRPLALSMVALELFSLGLAYYLIAVRRLGAVGLAIAVSLPPLVLVPLFHWRFGLSVVEAGSRAWFRDVLVPGFAPAAIAAPVWGGLAQIFEIDGWAELVLCVLAGGLVYAVAILFLMRPAERADLLRLRRRFGFGRI